MHWSAYRVTSSWKRAGPRPPLVFGPYTDQRFGKPGIMQKRWARAPPFSQSSSTVLPSRPVTFIGNR